MDTERISDEVTRLAGCPGMMGWTLVGYMAIANLLRRSATIDSLFDLIRVADVGVRIMIRNQS